MIPDPRTPGTDDDQAGAMEAAAGAREGEFGYP